MYGQFFGTVITQVVTDAISQGMAVGLNGALPSAGEAILGVAIVALDDNEAGAVCTNGVVYALAGGSFSAKGALKVDGAGKFIDQGGSGVIVGYALEAGSADKLVRVKLF
ncbi:MAG: DUF2190 family protein [Ignavibacteria bacterium]|nr:DUF2190 family protein [Ignavibacteria bacterium]